MSGLEIVGVVLGALPLAIEVLDRYGEVAKRSKSFIKIKLEYLEWKRRLRYSSLMYKRNLQDLLLPIILDAETEKDRISTLIEDPFGAWRWWTEPDTARMLKERLRGDSYDVYMDYIQAIEEVLEEIVDELALDDPTVQSMIAAPSKGTLLERLKGLRSTDNRHFQWHRFKYAVKSKERRTELFNTLDDYNTRIEKLLGGNDRLNDLSVQPPIIAPTQSKAAAAVNSALCSFWVTADKFFNALTSSWNCRCHTHCANLLLRHRTSTTPEFDVLFTKEQPSPETWIARKTRIVGKKGVEGGLKGTGKSQMSLPIHTPSHKDSRPLKSALGNTRKPKGKTAMFAGFQSTSTVTLIEVKEEEEAAHAVKSTISSLTTFSASVQAIQCLCTALGCPTAPGLRGQPSYGYLMHDDITYHVYDLPNQPIQQQTTITLQNIIDGKLLASLERKQRYFIAFTIASSFVQLLGSSWFPTTLTKTDIVFFRNNPPEQSSDEDTDEEDRFLDGDGNGTAFLDEPYVQRPVVASCESQQDKVPVSAYSSLQELGIILVELCFGKRLRDQDCWRRHNRNSRARDDYVRGIYDLMAANELKRKVAGEAGPDYAAAVKWCLKDDGSFVWGSKGGEVVKTLGKFAVYKNNNNMKGRTVEKWRKEMANNVVERLKACCDYLAGQRLEDDDEDDDEYY
ncbi:hypothetical protein B0T20DRAFT_467996 [Sordaria brevicollis]|uniref:DUF7580 domain-containing protein n=1 Tax=Sordaria brevicollis TaxID=83679 RepID=A0AAE0PGT6_SORBR|nr:hypothetical protein B0T20DRAFT_467996 [Sordaria brevicollis]